MPAGAAGEGVVAVAADDHVIARSAQGQASDADVLAVAGFGGEDVVAFAEEDVDGSSFDKGKAHGAVVALDDEVEAINREGDGFRVAGAPDGEGVVGGSEDGNCRPRPIGPRCR